MFPRCLDIILVVKKVRNNVVMKPDLAKKKAVGSPHESLRLAIRGSYAGVLKLAMTEVFA